MNQRKVALGSGMLVGVLALSGCGLDLGKFDYTEPEFVGSYVGDGATMVVALGKDRTFRAVGVPDEVLDDAMDGPVEEAPAELEGTWRYVSKTAPDRVELTVTDADGRPTELGELPLYVADADDLFFLPDRLGREKIMVSRGEPGR